MRLVPVAPDYASSVAFLTRWAPNGPWIITAIHPDKRNAPEPDGLDHTFITTRTFDTEPELEEFLEEYGEHRNLYFHVNPTLRPMSKKASRDDIKELAWLHVDVDPRAGEDPDAERARILNLVLNPPEPVPRPTCVVYSGGGYQAFWRLADPMPINGRVEAYEEAARFNLALELAFGADSCHNVDRIMRLPGTVNRPNAKKRKAGRQLVRAELVEWADGVYELEEFQKAALPAAAPTAPGGTDRMVIDTAAAPRLDDLSQLPPEVSGSAKIVIAQGRDPDDPNRHGASRSEWLFYVCCELVRGGCSDETIYGIITDPEWPISSSVLDKGKMVERYATRQIGRARQVTAATGEQLSTDKEGRPYQNLANFRLAIKLLEVRLEYDEFADRATVHNLEGFGPQLDDAAVTRLWLLLDERFGLHPGKDKFWSIVSDMARKNTRHPVREYLDDLVWDGTPRVERLLTTYFHAEDTDLHRAFARLVLVAAVRRVRKPGCKFDEMLVLESEQGTEKSTGLAALAVRSGWFSDGLYLGSDTKRQLETTNGRWILEASDLDGMKKAEVDSLKAWLSRSVDRARMSYERMPAERPRQFIVVGTTNHERYLRDTTGNRRFWPVKVGRTEIAALRRDRDQLWAEAAVLEAKGASIRLDPELWGDAAQVQAAREVEDPFLMTLELALGKVQVAAKIKAEDVWSILGVPTGQRSQTHNARLGDAMRRLGWRRTNCRFASTDGRSVKGYVNGLKGHRTEVEVNIDREGRPHVYIPEGVEEDAFA